jgi:hypothetical protein
MALQAITDGYSLAIGTVRMEGSWSGANDPVTVLFQWGYGSFGTSTPGQIFTLESGSFSRLVSVAYDRTMKFRAKATDDTGSAFGFSSGEFRTYAQLPSFPAGLTPGTPTTTTCPVTGSVIPNTEESTGEVYLEYRIQGTTIWSVVASPIASGISGTVAVPLSETLSGLVPGTAYEARFSIERTTENSQTNYSPVGTFTTASSAQTIISPQLMLATAEMFTPDQVGPDNSVQIQVLSPLEAQAEMLTPAVYVSQQAIIGLYIQFNDVVTREVIFG